MKLTYKIKLNLSDPEVANLQATLAQYREVLQHHAIWGFDHKTRSKRRAHVELYTDVKKLHPDFPTGLLQVARDIALGTLRSCRFKACPDFSKINVINYDARTMTLRGNQLTISQLGKRLKIIIVPSEYLKAKLTCGKVSAGQLVFHTNGSVWFHFIVTIVEPDVEINGDVLGIDLGIIHLAVTSEKQYYSGKQLRKARRKFLYNRKQLQKKGTQSARKRLKTQSGSEKRFVRNELHVLTKQIVLGSAASTIAIEDLSKFKSNAYHKKANKIASDFPFYQFKQFLTYKAALARKQVVLVDARFTSQKCSNCGHIYKGNRNKSRFKCVSCGFNAHADFNASLNIKQNHLLSLVAQEQAVVNQPYELDVLAQAPPLVGVVS